MSIALATHGISTTFTLIIKFTFGSDNFAK